MTGPWSTVEADPVESDELASARAWSVALEGRLSAVREVLTGVRDTGADRRAKIRQAIRLIDAELGAE